MGCGACPSRRCCSRLGVPAAILLAACVGSAEEFEPLLIQSSAELELARKKAAPPVLSVSPSRLRAVADEGAPASARLVVENSGGQTLA